MTLVPSAQPCERAHVKGWSQMITVRRYLGFAFMLAGAALAAYGLASSVTGIAVSGFGASAFGIILLGTDRNSSRG